MVKTASRDLIFNGVIREPETDTRNFHISQFVPKQDIIKDEEFCLPLPSREIILNQGRYGSCVAHSFAICKSILEYIQTGKWIDFDPYMIYGTRYTTDRYYGVGMYPKQGAKVLNKDGAFLRRDFNKRGEMPGIQDLVEEFKKNNPRLVEAAKDFQIEGYAFVNSVEEVKKALKSNMPVSAAWELYESFYDAEEDGIVSVPKYRSEDVLGLHQMTIVGWTANNRWIVINSWGTNEGLKGIYLIPFDYDFDTAIAVSDTITPCKKKAKEITLTVDKPYVIADGNRIDIDVAPQIINSRTYVPVRVVSELLGAAVEWLDKERRIIVRSEEAEIEMPIGSKYFVINGGGYKNDVAPIIVNDRTLIPIRVVAENLNCKVEWIDRTREIKINAL